MRAARLVLLTVVATGGVLAQTPSTTPADPVFDVVSVKRNTTNVLGSTVNQRPDGGFTMTNIIVATLISQAYPGHAPVDMVDLPGWATTERYDVSATSSLSNPTPEERAAMMRAMLADRFQLVVRVEGRETPVYDLVLARGDRRLGPGIKPSEVDCVARAAEEAAARPPGTPPAPPQAPALNAPRPPCSGLWVAGNSMEGDTTLPTLVRMFRPAAGRLVVDKTGLTGSYHVTMRYDRMAARRGPEVAPSPDAAPSVFTAVQEQLGMRLESSSAVRDTLVIERLERPSEN